MRPNLEGVLCIGVGTPEDLKQELKCFDEVMKQHCCLIMDETELCYIANMMQDDLCLRYGLSRRELYRNYVEVNYN